MPNYTSYSSPLSLTSRFNPLVGLHQEFLVEFNNFLHRKFLDLCTKISIPAERFEYLNIDDLITEREFAQINMELAKPYFYEKIFNNIFKNTKAKVENKLRFTFTYDVDLTPIRKGNSQYGVINLGSKPILYYCYIDLQEVIRFIKGLDEAV